MMKKSVLISLVLSGLCVFVSHRAWALENTTFHNIRTGLHDNYTRVVFDLEGAKPFRIGPASQDQITIEFESLELQAEDTMPSHVSYGAIEAVTYSSKEETDTSNIRIAFKPSGNRIQTAVLASETGVKGRYRLVVDVYPKKNAGSMAISADQNQSEVSDDTRKSSNLTDSSENPRKPQEPISPLILAAKEQADPDISAPDTGHAPYSPHRIPFSGDISLLVTAASGDDDSAKFNEYRDLSRTLSGDLNLELGRNKDFFSFSAKDIARDDQRYDATFGWYGRGKIRIGYDEIPHRFAYDAGTLYSGIGSSYLALDDGLQSRIESGLSTIQSEFSSATSNDLELKRKKIHTEIDLTALEQFRFALEFNREKRDGTRPIFGAFGLLNTIEIPEPVDYETTDMRFTAEYELPSFIFNISYYLSVFNNNFDIMGWENPFRLTDKIGESSAALLDLAPDNLYNDVSISGSYMGLPLKSRLSFSAAWGWMTQDDDLVPYTINSAAGAPALSGQVVDAKVNTALYNVTLTSRPFERLHLTGKFRFSEYKNKTEKVSFPGYVDADDIFVPITIENIPTSHKKTTAGLNMGLDLFQTTRMNLGYFFDKTDRTNRQVDEQTKHTFKTSLDTSPYSWLDLKTSYERAIVDVDDYRFDVYLSGGKGLDQLPLLRMSDQADMVRDRIQFLATIYLFEELILSGSAIYGWDDFKDSPYGLLEDNHRIISLDADYRMSERLILSAYYSNEYYMNRQKDNGLVDVTPDSNWFSKSEDKINTIGLDAEYSAIREKLDLKLSYSFSDVDGKIGFFSPVVSLAEFKTVDETKMHTLNMAVNYHPTKNWSFIFGYLWEKFDYGDFNEQGFSLTPSGAVLMGTLPQDYDVNLVYIRTTYHF